MAGKENGGVLFSFFSESSVVQMHFRVQSIAILEHPSLDAERVEIFPQALQGPNLGGRD